MNISRRLESITPRRSRSIASRSGRSEDWRSIVHIPSRSRDSASAPVIASWSEEIPAAESSFRRLNEAPALWPSTRRRAAFAAAIPAATRSSPRATDIQFVISPLATTSGHDSIGAIRSIAKRSASSA